MSNESTESSQPTTHEDLTIRPAPESRESTGAEHPEGGSDIILSAEETQFVAVGGPRSGGEDEGGTEDYGINPTDEIPSAG